MRNQPVCNTAIANSVRPQTQVEGMLKSIDESLAHLTKVFEEHCEKLTPVTRSEPPSGDDGKVAPPEEVLVPVADRLRLIHRRITGLRIQLESLSERVEA